MAKKYSLKERIDYYTKKKQSTKSNLVKAKCVGFLNVFAKEPKSVVLYGFTTAEEMKAFNIGAIKGHKAKEKSINVKF